MSGVNLKYALFAQNMGNSGKLQMIIYLVKGVENVNMKMYIINFQKQSLFKNWMIKSYMNNMITPIVNIYICTNQLQLYVKNMEHFTLKHRIFY